MARSKRSNRLALNTAGEDVSDFTEAVRAVYQYVEPGEDGKDIVIDEIEFNPDEAAPELVRAYAIFGFHTHAGNHINKGVNTAGLEGEDLLEHIAEYRTMMSEAGWTTRKGEATAGAGIFILAYARIRARDDGLDLEEIHDKVKAAWAEKWTDEDKEAIKKDDVVKAEVAAIRAERAAAKAEGKTTAPALPAL